MTRKIVLGALATILSVTPPAWSWGEPTDPPTLSVVHEAVLPCTLACAYYLPSESGFDECEPPASGSHDVSTFRMTSDRGLVTVHAWPELDWDMFLCTDTEPSTLIQCLGCNSFDMYECRGPGGNTTHLGCEIYDYITWSGIEAASPGSNGRFRLVSYMWLDRAPLPINLWGSVELIDDSFEANIAGNRP